MAEAFLLTPLGTTDLLRIGVVVLFGAIIFLSFIYGTVSGWLLKRRDPKNDFHKEPTRVIGGLGILVIAIVAHNPAIYGVALFIGGLLIASEKFMINLAAIFNSDRKSVHKISERWTEANLSQVEQKQEQEAEEGAALEEVQESPQGYGTKGTKSGKEVDARLDSITRQRLTQLKNVEVMTLKYLRQKVEQMPGKSLKRYVQEFPAAAPKGRIHDAIVIDDNTNKVLFSIEVLYRAKLHPAVLRVSIRRAVERVKSNDFPLLLALVYKEEDGVTNDYLLKYRETIHEKYPDVGIVYYKDEEEMLTVIDETDLEKLLDADQATLFK